MVVTGRRRGRWTLRATVVQRLGFGVRLRLAAASRMRSVTVGCCRRLLLTVRLQILQILQRLDTKLWGGWARHLTVGHCWSLLVIGATVNAWTGRSCYGNVLVWKWNNLQGVRVETEVGLSCECRRRRSCCRRGWCCCGRLLGVRRASALAVAIHRRSRTQRHRIRLLHDINQSINSFPFIELSDWADRRRKKPQRHFIAGSLPAMDGWTDEVNLLESSVRGCGNPQRMERGDWRWATTLKSASVQNWAATVNGCCCCCCHFHYHRFRRNCFR